MDTDLKSKWNRAVSKVKGLGNSAATSVNNLFDPVVRADKEWRELQKTQPPYKVKDWDEGRSYPAPDPRVPTGEMNLYAARKTDPKNPYRGTYDVMQALPQAYGNPAPSDMQRLVDQVRDARRKQQVEQIPSEVKWDRWGDMLTEDPRVNKGQVPTDEDRAYAREQRLKRGESYYPSDSDAHANIFDPVTTWKDAAEARDDEVRRARAEGDDDVVEARRAWDIRNGLRNPYTQIDAYTAPGADRTNSGQVHELTHAMDPYRHDAARSEKDTRQIVRAYETGTYNTSPVEAVQSATQMKRLAYNEFYKQHGRWPSSDSDLRAAYDAVSKDVDSLTPANAEHARAINEMVETIPIGMAFGGDWKPTQEEKVRLERESRMKQYERNRQKWLDAMLEKDPKTGVRFQDLLIQNRAKPDGGRWTRAADRLS